MKIKTNLNNLIFIGFALLWFSSCEKDSAEPTILKYDMKYLVKINGDKDLISIIVRSDTYYSQVNRKWMIRSGKYKIDSLLGSRKYLNEYDSILIQPADKVYKGCTRKMGVEFCYTEGIDTIYKYFLFPEKKIYLESDCRLEFNWPDDSSKYENYESDYWW